MNWQRALAECAHVMKQMHDVRLAGFDTTALAFPRDDLAYRMLCAWNGVDPSHAPNGWRFFPNEGTKKAWGRVANLLASDQDT